MSPHNNVEIIDEVYIKRCIQLAALGSGFTAPNPMVGSVLVYKNKIIGEGYHQIYGQAHAEVNCINSVADEDKSFINQSTLYVSLEPCAHFGKTPPCADLILKYNIPRVVIGCLDPFVEVQGRGIEKLVNAGIKVTTGILEKDCLELNKRFITFQLKKRPFIVLKWAETANHFIGNNNDERLLISNKLTNKLIHKWRSEEAAILVGTKTALKDNPSLNNRLWYGKQPIRLVIDKQLEIPITHYLLNKEQQTIVFNYLIDSEELNLHYYQLNKEKELLQQILDACYKLNIQSILVEGGNKTLQTFIEAGIWDEARIITNKELTITDGIVAPMLTNAVITNEINIASDHIMYFKNYA